MAFATNPKIVGTPSGELPEIIHDLLEADSMSFATGELIYSNDGAITNCADDAVVILGIAQKAATNVSSGNIEIKVEQILPSYRVRMLISTGGTAGSSSNMTVGNAYGLDVTSNVWTADYGDTDNDAVVFKSHCYDAAGNKTNYGVFQFLPAVCQGQTGN